MKRTLSISILLLTVIIASISCSSSDKLNEKKAQALINEHYEYPNVMVSEIPLGYNAIGLHNEKLSPLVNANLVIIEKDRNIGTISRLSHQGKQYVPASYQNKKNMVSLAVRSFKSIDGIHLEPANNTATVTFSVTLSKVTPFGEFYGQQESGEIPYTVPLKKDEVKGWYIDDKKPPNFKITDVACFSDDFISNTEPSSVTQGGELRENLNKYLNRIMFRESSEPLISKKAEREGQKYQDAWVNLETGININIEKQQEILVLDVKIGNPNLPEGKYALWARFDDLGEFLMTIITKEGKDGGTFTGYEDILTYSPVTGAGKEVKKFDFQKSRNTAG